MNRLPKWIAGFLRLFVVVFVVGWVVCALFLVKTAGAWLVLGPILPDFKEPTGVGPFPNDWCVITASSEFLSKPDSERIELANKYFQEEIEWPAEEYNFDVEEVRKWIVWTATLSLEKAPIQEHSSVGYGIIKYRDFPLTNMPTMKIWRVLFDATTLGLTLVSTVIFILFTIVVFLSVRWVARGFRGHTA